MRLTSLAFIGLAAIATTAHADDNEDRGWIRTMMKLRGAPCGEIMGTYKEPSSGTIIAQCNNGMVYAARPIDGGKNWVLGQRNSLTGAWNPY